MNFRTTVEDWFKIDKIEIFSSLNQNIATLKIGCFCILIEESEIGCMGTVKVGDCVVCRTPNEQGNPLIPVLQELTMFLNIQREAIESSVDK